MRCFRCPSGGVFFILLLTLAVALLPADARSAPPLRIGVILGSDLPTYQQSLAAFRKKLEQEDVGGRIPELFVQSPNPDFYSWANSARRAQAAGCRIIVVFGDAASEVTRREIAQTPLVLAYLDDSEPDKAEMGGGSRRPNETGVLARIPVSTLLKTCSQIHAFPRLSALFSAEDPEIEELSSALDLASHRLQSSYRQVRIGPELDAQLAQLATEPGEPLFLSESAFTLEQLDQLLAFAKARKLPVLTQISGLAQRGALISLSPDPEEQGEWAANYALRILRGEKPAAIPYREPTSIQLVINLKAAENLGLRVSFQALSAATAIIQ